MKRKSYKANSRNDSCGNSDPFYIQGTIYDKITTLSKKHKRDPMTVQGLLSFPSTYALLALAKLNFYCCIKKKYFIAQFVWVMSWFGFQIYGWHIIRKFDIDLGLAHLKVIGMDLHGKLNQKTLLWIKPFFKWYEKFRSNFKS